ncbi:MAG TPA: nucleotidyltransferase family protein [Planctomycetaceae bacterium]|nr:nucleotidyltransferase family protein [Planctomycetaceae bacterium]
MDAVYVKRNRSDSVGSFGLRRVGNRILTELGKAEAPLRIEPATIEAAIRWIGAANVQAGGDRLLAILNDPSRLAELSHSEQLELRPLARFCGVWSQLANSVLCRGEASQFPQTMQKFLRSAQLGSGAHEARIRWEADRLQEALCGVSCPLVLLKGTAFLFSGFAFARGRRFADIDLLVPKESLPEVEAALRRHGWVHSEERALHVEYFRTWLQEIAPMWHPERMVQVDIHYTIIPPKDRIPFDPRTLFERAVLLGDGPFRVLAPSDMFLHATSNLFRTGEFTYLLRDLWDMSKMLDEFSREPRFWNELVERAAELHLQQTCFLALRYVRKVFATPVPEQIIAATDRWRPNPVFLAIVDACVRRCLFPRTLDRPDSGRNFVLWLREYWPPPRLRTYFSYLFWRKRLPSSRRIDGLDKVQNGAPANPDRGVTV